jgi:hypothetical protein
MSIGELPLTHQLGNLLVRFPCNDSVLWSTDANGHMLVGMVYNISPINITHDTHKWNLISFTTAVDETFSLLPTQ